MPKPTQQELKDALRATNKLLCQFKGALSNHIKTEQLCEIFPEYREILKENLRLLR